MRVSNLVFVVKPPALARLGTQAEQFVLQPIEMIIPRRSDLELSRKRLTVEGISKWPRIFLYNFQIFPIVT